IAFLSITLDLYLILQTGYHDLAITHFGRSMDCDQVAVPNAGVAHTHALDSEQEVRLLLEQIRIDLIASLDVLLRQKRRTCRNSSNERQPQLLTQRIFESNSSGRAPQQ